MTEKAVTYHIRIDDGPEGTITVETGIYILAVAVIPAITGVIPELNRSLRIEIWSPRLLPEYGPYNYEVGHDVYQNVVVRPVFLAEPKMET